MEDLLTSRRDIEKLMLILAEWQKDHPQDDKEQFCKELLNKLDVIHMSW